MSGWFRMTLLRGVVYKEKSIGPRTEPWGTPHRSFFAPDRREPILTHGKQSERYDLNHSKTTPPMPNQGLNHSRTVPWLIVSNAADWSSSTTAVASPQARARWTMFLIDSSAVRLSDLTYKLTGKAYVVQKFGLSTFQDSWSKTSDKKFGIFHLILVHQRNDYLEHLL